jgi:fatty-acyl-CoA synthase
VIAVRDEKWGERPHVIVVARAGRAESLTAAAVRDWIAKAARAGTLPRYAIPERVTLVDALPKTSVGKLNKRVLREQFY